MSNAEYALNALDEARAHAQAQSAVARWTNALRESVLDEMPPVAKQAGFLGRHWLLAVEVQRRDWETAQAAAQRVAQWITLHAETYGRPPSAQALVRPPQVCTCTRNPLDRPHGPGCALAQVQS